MKVLFVDCCIREAGVSRTGQLCQAFLKNVLEAHPDYELETLVLKNEDLKPYRNEDVELRNQVLKAGDLDHPILRYAKQFAAADRILIGAPYWDLSFPSLLKIYIEHIYANGIVFKYEGPKPVGLCKADKLMYIQTVGGFAEEKEPGTMYLKAVCDMLGIPKFERICADGLDIIEIPTEPRMQAAYDQIAAVAPTW